MKPPITHSPAMIGQMANVGSLGAPAPSANPQAKKPKAETLNAKARASSVTPAVPGGEPGDHVVIQYRRRIKAGDTILEVLYMRRTGDGWRTVGYRLLDER